MTDKEDIPTFNSVLTPQNAKAFAEGISSPLTKMSAASLELMRSRILTAVHKRDLELLNSSSWDMEEE